MTNKNITELTMVIWGAMGIALAALFISAAAAQAFTVFHMITAILLVVAPFLATEMIWQWGGVLNKQSQDLDETFSEKAKRERIDQVLRNLSNAELLALKKRLSQDDIDDDLLEYYLQQGESDQQAR